MSPRVFVVILIAALALVAALVLSVGQSPSPERVGPDATAGDPAPDARAAPAARIGDDVAAVARSGQGFGAEPEREHEPERAIGERPTWRCSGTIRDPDGNPVQGVQIVVYEPSAYGPGGRIVAEFVTGDDGAYAMTLEGRPGLRIAVDREGYFDVREDLRRRPLEGRDFVLRPVE